MSFMIVLFDINEEKLKNNLDYYFSDHKIPINVFGVTTSNKHMQTSKHTLSS